jgi:hypothetical protein
MLVTTNLFCFISLLDEPNSLIVFIVSGLDNNPFTSQSPSASAVFSPPPNLVSLVGYHSFAHNLREIEDLYSLRISRKARPVRVLVFTTALSNAAMRLREFWLSIALAGAARAAYILQDDYQPEKFLDMFDFFDVSYCTS